MGVEKRVTTVTVKGTKTKRELEVITYDRDAETTFNSYSPEEIIHLKTLMRHVGGSSAVGYEMFKQENGYTDGSKRLVIVTDKDGNPTGEQVYKPIREIWKESPKLRGAYTHRIMVSLHMESKNRSKSRNITHEVAVIINKLSERKQRHKDKVLMKGVKFIASAKDSPKNPVDINDRIAIKNAVESITIEPQPEQQQDGE